MAPAEPNAIPFRTQGDVPFFAEEREGWKGYVEWEKYPEKRKRAEEILANYDFPVPPEFQLEPLPRTNPILTGERWKQYHYALGPTLEKLPDISWKYVLQEKSADMIHVLQFPYNGEPPRTRLVENEITPNKDFFVRNHGGIPEINPSAYTFDISGLVKNPQRLTLADLKNEDLFPRITKTVTLQCSGTRRIEQIQQYPGDGDELINAPWGEGAIGAAKWTGVSLKKVIKRCGGLVDDAAHLEFFGADSYFKKKKIYNYVVSVPWRKVKANEVMLAWEMNGEPLPKIHGFPLRAVVFGYIGARSCKWLYEIRAIKHESMAPVQKKEYLYYTPQVGKQNTLYSNGFSIQDMPVSSAIMTPLDKEQIVHEGKIKLRGWAYSGGGHWPIRVEVSGDGGSVWYEVPYEKLSTKYFHAWRLWEIELPVDAEGWLEFCVRTWDNALNTQPTYVRSAWNWDLHVTSSCHRIKVYSMNKTRPLTAKRLKQLEDKGISILPITHPMEFDLETDEEYEVAMEARGGRDPKE
ncbi:oxidoreductase molybdopterin binding domain-containing protein [Pseudomassariella vexata]|uniref:Oxidoreductase molybdopterin binding domain-containing protein n=1 Tax=Pseudomassariella vexata TaxID=1141098 RepID=A0A1Y2DUT7_9PEZI|nr:oxidoreductase molybdopterin binding domain-containing protein [Pseudomassariella vexata]ORY62415.1 oxidoreductase molybdopterin binding domain-containing protein [Pseudomassariella vexata]